MTKRSSDMQQLTEYMTKGGWQALSCRVPKAGARLDALFSCDYGVAGVVMVPGAKQVLSCWPQSQQALIEAVENDKHAAIKDHYLLFIVDKIEDADRGALRRVINDTHECRKFCLERRGRPLARVLGEAPFLSIFSPRDQDGEDLHIPTETLTEANLTSKLLDDLGKRSASTILDRLMRGDYGGGDEDNEDQEC